MITTPTLLLDEDKCRANIKAMVSKVRESDVDFRPHFKTHQSLEIGRWFRAEGVDRITVSSLEMAEYFSEEWDDITVAFPVNILEIETINRLARQIKLNLLVESLEAAAFLAEHLEGPAGFFLKIDVGYNRTGLAPGDTHAMDRILEAAGPCENLVFKGFLAHAGHTYRCGAVAEIIAIHDASVEMMAALKARYLERYPGIIVSLGDTPGCSLVDRFSGVDELRPGNFVFYDLTQRKLGACTAAQIAVAVACPVVAVHKEKNEMVIYGGGVHFSKEGLPHDELGTIFGRVVEPQGDAWGDMVPGAWLKPLSQEHGVVAIPEQEISRYKIGDLVLILPVHSCMTANLMNSYTTTQGKRIEKI